MVWFAAISSICIGDLGAQSTGSLKKQGEAFFEAKQYRSALNAFRQAGLETTKNKVLRQQMGICLYEINDVDNALQVFNALINEGRTDPVVYLYAAKCLQARYRFTDAISHYKKYLQDTSPNDSLRNWVKDELLRCANGNRLNHAEQIAYVENAGATINTQYADFGVRTSPTTIDKIYFNSDRDDVTMAKQANGNIDIYSASLINGRWSTPSALPGHINTMGYDQVYGFSTNGQILYYLTAAGKNFVIRTDTFSQEQPLNSSGQFNGPFLSSHGGADLFFFNDSICLFSSDRPGGYGGYDLYISLLQNGSWTKAVNLGPEINSHFQERFPFLTKDGMTLYFSSDNLESIGGLDVFYSTFDPKLRSWISPQNCGIPINSPLDDGYFVLAPDGMTGYLSSDRKEGHGAEDIYRVFFKRPVEAHQRISAYPTFYHLPASSNLVSTTETTSSPKEIKEYFISHLMMDDEGEVLTPQNIKKLDVLINLLTIFPNVRAQLGCFEMSSGQRSFNLYFSIKKAEKAADYLYSRGIAHDRILLKGYGASFPLAKNPVASSGTTPNKVNQRVEIDVLDYANEAVKIHTEKIKVPENIRDPKGQRFASLRHQLFYCVQIASISQILQNEAIEQVEEMFIEKDPVQGNYIYMAGMSATFKEAEKVLSQMITLGFSDARIIPYLNSVRIPAASVPDLAKQYPDLLFYLASTKK